MLRNRIIFTSGAGTRAASFFLPGPGPEPHYNPAAPQTAIPHQIGLHILKSPSEKLLYFTVVLRKLGKYSYVLYSISTAVVKSAALVLNLNPKGVFTKFKPCCNNRIPVFF
jgi:hypothetical protein